MTPTSGLSRVEHGWSAWGSFGWPHHTLPALLGTRPFGGLVGPELPQLQKGGERSTLLYLRCWPPGFVIDPGDPNSYDIIRATWIISGRIIWESLEIIMKNEVSWTWLLFFLPLSMTVSFLSRSWINHSRRVTHPPWFAVSTCFQPHPSEALCLQVNWFQID